MTRIQISIILLSIAVILQAVTIISLYREIRSDLKMRRKTRIMRQFNDKWTLKAQRGEELSRAEFEEDLVKLKKYGFGVPNKDGFFKILNDVRTNSLRNGEK